MPDITKISNDEKLEQVMKFIADMNFVAEEEIVKGKRYPRTSMIYNLYLNWCYDNNIEFKNILRNKAFFVRFSLFFKYKKMRHNNCYMINSDLFDLSNEGIRLAERQYALFNLHMRKRKMYEENSKKAAKRKRLELREQKRLTKKSRVKQEEVL